MTNSGYVVVRKESYVGEHWGDKPLALRNSRYPAIQYRGIDRDPWWDLSGLYYEGRLSEADQETWMQINNTKINFFSAGVCATYTCAQRALVISNHCANQNEIIFVSLNDGLVTEDNLQLMGFDYYVDGYGSMIRLGLFTKPKFFTAKLDLLNSHGLFDSPESLSEYINAYVAVSDEANVERIDLKDNLGASFAVYCS